jgi:hypothetical protein
LQQPLTIVLPMHNNERQIRSTVLDVLDLAVHIRINIRVVIMDDGSTDDTFEAACELARRFPQVEVLRQPVRSGLSAATDLVRSRLGVDMVIMHDGVSEVDITELKHLLLESSGRTAAYQSATVVEEGTQAGSRRFAAVRELQKNMERAHRSALGFCCLKLDRQVVPRRRQVPEKPLETPKIVPVAGYLADLPTSTPAGLPW